MKYKKKYYHTPDETRYYFLKADRCYCEELKDDVLCMWCAKKLKKIVEHVRDDNKFFDEDRVIRMETTGWNNMDEETIQF